MGELALFRRRLAAALMFINALEIVGAFREIVRSIALHQVGARARFYNFRLGQNEARSRHGGSHARTGSQPGSDVR
jgi:hypothetical protein